MNPEGNDQDLGPSVISTIEEGLATACDDDANGRQDAVTVDPTVSETSLGTIWSRSTIDTIPSVADGKAVLPVGGWLDIDRTISWDPHETSVAVETTFGPSIEPSSDTFRPTSGASCGEGLTDFEILCELGHGGMGIVYKARQVKLKRLVALKMIRDDWHNNPVHLARFEIEAEAVARLSHPNIVRIHEIGRAGRFPYVVLELLEGGTLKQRLASTPQPAREAASLLSTLARAVNAAHVADILHRDLKPSNVLFDQCGIPKIVDFGLAKRLEIEDGQTQTGQVIGTPSYMSPEQAKGWDREIGPAADIYSLGAILYEMLTGRPPFKGTTPSETLKLVLEEDPLPPSRLRPKLPFDLETICLKCISRDPRKRYASALALAEDLDRYLAGEPILARRTPLWARAIKLARKRPAITALMTVGIVATAVTIGMVQLEQTRRKERVDGLLRHADPALYAAQDALVRKSWAEVRSIASKVLSRIETESDVRLTLVRVRAESLDREAQRGLEEETATEQAQDQFHRFLALRDEALFLDSRFGGLDQGNSLEATCRTARDGLEVFGLGAAADEWALAQLPPSLSSKDQDDVKAGFYELLLILADAVSQLPEDEPGQRAEEALRIVNRAISLRSTATRAFHLRRSAYLDMGGDSEEAARERDEAERLAPAEAFDFFLVGRELMRRSDWVGAIQQFKAVTQRQPDHFWAQCLLAICHLQINQPTNALIGLNACLQRKPDSVWLYLLRGIASANEGIFARKIAPRDSGQAASLAALASEKFKDAEADYVKALGLLGNGTKNAELYYVLLVNRGLIRVERQDLTAAAVDLRQAICLNDHRFDAFSALGQVYQRQGRTQDALKQFARAIQLRPNWAPLYRGRADVLVCLKNLSSEQRDAALSDLEDAIRCESPENPAIAADRIKQARLLYHAGRRDEALDACDAALSIAPRFAPAHLLRIRLLLEQKHYDDLLQSCDIALESTKPSAELHELRGMAKDDLEDFPGAIADYTLSLSLSLPPERPRLLRRRGWSYLANEAYYPAIHDFDETIHLAPSNADAYSGRGLARAHLGQHAAAVSDAQKALKHGGSSWRIACNAARIYAQAAIAAESESRKTGPVAVRLVNRYQARAFELVRLALQRAPAEQRSVLFRDTIQVDPALQPIRRWLRSLESLKLDPPRPTGASPSPD
jgi:tetratricopeptide (TPR) repeat protein/tRNA A-37 threonylcarbamoyl transferase component Bud32